MNVILNQFSIAAKDPAANALAWKQKTGKKVVGTFAMHFPAEVIHASGALPVMLQSSDDAITAGHAGMYPFFCAYTRSLVDQNARGQLDYLDSIMFGDHCVQLLSAADIIRIQKPERQVGFYQLIPALKDNWSLDNAQQTLRDLIEGLEEELDVKITDADIQNSIRVFNKNRQLMRELYDLRRQGRVRISSVQMQDVIKSSMVMDKSEHNILLEELLEAARIGDLNILPEGIPLYLSGHMCHAPKPELLSMIESCGVTVVADDLYHGLRYISTDASDSGDPVRALAQWYIKRNSVVPCPTRLDPDIDWDGWLLNSVRESGASGLVVLMPKFCEPHYFYYPQIKKTFETAGIPHLLLETEHELNVGGGLRTRIESFVELIKQRNSAVVL